MPFMQCGALSSFINNALQTLLFGPVGFFLMPEHNRYVAGEAASLAALVLADVFKRADEGAGDLAADADQGPIR